MSACRCCDFESLGLQKSCGVFILSFNFVFKLATDLSTDYSKHQIAIGRLLLHKANVTDKLYV